MEDLWKDGNSWVIEMTSFKKVLECSENSLIKIVIFIIENTNTRTNLFMKSYTDIHNGTGVDYKFIPKIMKQLQECNFITKIQNAVWEVNYSIIRKSWRGMRGF